MKKFKMIMLIIAIVIVTTVAIVWILRAYNDKKYCQNKALDTPKYYSNVTDINLYPKNIDGVDVQYVDQGAFQGFRMTPHNRTHKGVIVCYGGSEGSPNFENAERLAKQGYETLAVFMFGMKNQPKTLTRIPLEQFEDVLKYINETIDNKEPITVLGASKGAEYALNLATKYDEISNLILIAPSAYTFAGLDFNDYGSSWTYENKELPYVDLKRSSFPVLIKDILIPSLTKAPIGYKDLYASAVKYDPDIANKLIPVKDIKANILIIAGDDDQIWNSVEMGNVIKDQNEKAIVVSYKNAGHIFMGNGVLCDANIKLKAGGSLEGNNKANIEANKEIDEFLAKYAN